MRSEAKEYSYECLECGWQSMSRPKAGRCPECKHAIYEQEYNKPKSTALPNDLEQAPDKREFYKSVLNDFIELYPAVNLQQRHADMLFKCFDKVSEHALSTIPDLIKKVLERAAENAKIIDFASNYIDHGKTGAQIFEVDKQSILDTKFDDLIK